MKLKSPKIFLIFLIFLSSFGAIFKKFSLHKDIKFKKNDLLVLCAGKYAPSLNTSKQSKIIHLRYDEENNNWKEPFTIIEFPKKFDTQSIVFTKNKLFVLNHSPYFSQHILKFKINKRKNLKYSFDSDRNLFKQWHNRPTIIREKNNKLHFGFYDWGKRYKSGLHVLNLRNGAILKKLESKQSLYNPIGMTFSEDKMFISNIYNSSISIYSLDNYKFIKTIEGESNNLFYPLGLFADKDKLFVIDHTYNFIGIYDINKNNNLVLDRIIGGKKTLIKTATHIIPFKDNIIISNLYGYNLLLFDKKSSGNVEPKKIIDININKEKCAPYDILKIN